MTELHASFQADAARYPTDGDPAGEAIGRLLSEALAREGIAHRGPDAAESLGWELEADGDVRVWLVVGLADPGQRRWQAAIDASSPLLRRFGRSAARDREEALRRWAAVVDRALRDDPAVGAIRWRDGETWTDAPPAA